MTRLHHDKRIHQQPAHSKSQQHRGNSTKSSYQGGSNERSKCNRCGLSPCHNRQACPAKDAKCRKCAKKGHYAIMCLSKKVFRRMEEAEDDIILGSIVDDTATVNNLKQDLWHADVSVNGQRIKFRVDTGKDVFVVPERYFRKHSSAIKASNKKLYGPAKTEINVVGRFQATLTTEKARTVQDLYVIKTLQESLLGRPAIEALHLLERVNSVVSPLDSGIRKEFPELFTGLGKLKMTYRITMKKDAVPFAVTAPRRVPLPMQQKVKDDLERLEDLDVIRPMTTPTDWCVPIVVVPKANNKVRVCVDLTKLNDSVRREKFPLPTTDELLAQLSGATTFSKLDCNSGFYQIPLAEESQPLTTFITPYGRFCFKRLPVGINPGPEVFHREMTHILTGIPGVIVDIDDVLVSGKTQQEHDDRLRVVLCKLRDSGITLNEKCVFSTDTVKFLGHIISKEGIEIDPEKISAITKCSQPTNVPELRRFIGMVNHVGKVAPNLAETTKPLRDLLRKENDWTWNTHQEVAFQNLKQQLSSAPILAHYSPAEPTKVSADASPYGMGGVQLQKDSEGWKPIFYASWSMTPTEQRYAQVEKEALAMTWCCEKFADYLVGLPQFTIETDHKPLLALMKKKNLDELSPRIQRFRMRMMRVSYDVDYTPGKNLLTADTLSRAPESVPAEQDRRMDIETTMFVQSVMEGLPATDKRLEEIRQKQSTDNVCIQVANFCKSDHWPHKAETDTDLKAYWAARNDLTVHQGLLMYQGRLVTPQEMQADILQRIHQGHQGIVKCRALARSCVW